jgi:uncharacterized protein (TIGR02300 family)
VAKPELGTKRVCPETGRKFYDLNKDPVISPYTGKVVPVEAPPVRARPEQVPVAPVARPAAAAPAPAPVEEVATPEPQETELVSLEEAEAESQGAKGPVETSEPDIEEEVEMDETLDDDDSTFIEEQEEEDADVTDIIGGDIENEEEG